MAHGCTVRQWVIFVTVLTLVSSTAHAQPKKQGPAPAPVTTARVEEGAFDTVYVRAHLLILTGTQGELRYRRTGLEGKR